METATEKESVKLLTNRRTKYDSENKEFSISIPLKLLNFRDLTDCVVFK